MLLALLISVYSYQACNGISRRQKGCCIVFQKPSRAVLFLVLKCRSFIECHILKQSMDIRRGQSRSLVNSKCFLNSNALS